MEGEASKGCSCTQAALIKVGASFVSLGCASCAREKQTCLDVLAAQKTRCSKMQSLLRVIEEPCLHLWAHLQLWNLPSRDQGSNLSYTSARRRFHDSLALDFLRQKRMQHMREDRHAWTT